MSKLTRRLTALMLASTVAFREMPLLSVYAEEEPQREEPAAEVTAVSEEAPQPAPVIEAPAPAQTNESQPAYSEPVYTEPAPVYYEPVYTEPVYEAPVQEVPVYTEPVQVTETPAVTEAPAEIKETAEVQDIPAVQEMTEEAVQTEAPAEEVHEENIPAVQEAPVTEEITAADVSTEITETAEVQEIPAVQEMTEEAVQTEVIAEEVHEEEIPAVQEIPVTEEVKENTVDVSAEIIETVTQPETQETVKEEPVQEEVLPEPEIKVNAAPKMMMAAAPKLAASEPTKVTVHVNNVINSLKGIPSETSFDVTQGGTKTLTATGSLSFVGGKNYKTSYMGVNYTFLNAYALSSADGEPVYWESLDDGVYVTKVKDNKDNTATLTFSDGTTQVVEEVYLSPIYKQDPKWLLEYDYVDEVSTGSGSWSNRDAVTSYSHTFKDPDEPEHYQFEYWKDESTGKTYNEGDTFTYTAADKSDKFLKEYYEEHGELYKEEIITNAYWQPDVTVNYYVNNVLEKAVSSFKDAIQIYSYTPEDEDEKITFEGWYEENDWQTRIEEDRTEAAPEITNKAGSARTINVFARFTTFLNTVKQWADGNNADGIRPASVTAELSANGEAVQQAELNAANNWSYTFEDLSAYDPAGTKIEYTVDEPNVPAGYTKTVEVTDDGVTITNSHTVTPRVIPETEPDPGPGPGPGIIPEPEPEPPVPPVVPAVIPQVIPEAPQAEPEIIPEPTVPQAEPAPAVIDDPKTPLEVPVKYWALLNLILTMLTALVAAGMGVSYFRRKDDEEEEEENVKQNTEGEEDEEEKAKRRISKFLGIIPAVLAVILFLLTEDTRNTMILTDKWTLLTAVIAAVNIIAAYLTRNKQKDEEEEDEELAAA